MDAFLPKSNARFKLVKVRKQLAPCTPADYLALIWSRKLMEQQDLRKGSCTSETDPGEIDAGMKAVNVGRKIFNLFPIFESGTKDVVLQIGWYSTQDTQHELIIGDGESNVPVLHIRNDLTRAICVITISSWMGHNLATG